MEEYKIILKEIPAELCSSEERWWILAGIENKPDDSIFYFYNKGMARYYYPLNTRLTQWVKEYNIRVKIDFTLDDQWHLVFLKKSDAMLFKLRWINI